MSDDLTILFLNMFSDAFAAFDAFDTNKDGSIDFKELILALAISEQNYADSMVDTFFTL